MARHNRQHCWDVIFKYPRRIGSVTFIDVHAHTRDEAKQRTLTDPSFEAGTVISERGQPASIVAHRRPRYHGWFEELS